MTNEASPKAISRRTSYLRVRLEFLPYPQLMPTLFNGCGFGPPKTFTSPSAWSWIDHPVSGLLTLTIRAFNTWYPFGSVPLVLNLASICNSPDRSTKSTRLCSYGTSTACKHRVSGSLSLPSRGSFHLSLTVLCAIGHHIVFRLGRWSSLLPAGFLVSCGTLVLTCRLIFSPTRLLLSLAALSNASRLRSRVRSVSPQPRKACSPVWPLSRSLAAT